MTRVEEVMNHPAIVCKHRDMAMLAAALMLEHDCGVIPIVDEGNRLVGIITDRDVCMAAYTESMAIRDIYISDVMTRKVVHCAPRDTLGHARKLMEQGLVRRLPVVDEEQQVVGILSSADLLQEASAGDMVRVLATVSRPRRPAAMAHLRVLGSTS